MEQTNINEQQERLSEMQARLNKYKTLSNKMQVQLNRRRAQLIKMTARLYEHEAKYHAKLKITWDNCLNWKRVAKNMEFALSQNEHIDTIWKLCDELREIHYIDYEGSKEQKKYECIYDKYEYKVRRKNNIIEWYENKIREYNEYVDALIEYGSKYGFNLSK
jgi:septal ring factor EnvC (AmiA/AmiB activator)